MGVTIKDVARAANVAPSTVSRVVANHPRISEKTKQRVREAMEQLGYHPNYQARSLASKSSQTIGLVMPDSTDRIFQNPFFPEVIRGISKIAHSREYAICMSTGETEAELYDGVVRMVQGGRVDGLILLYSKINDRVTNYLKERNFPFVMVGKPHIDMDAINHVDNDNYSAAKEITEYLIQKGHERIAFVGGSPDMVVTIDRLEGYKQAITQASLTLHDEYIVREKVLREGGEEAAIELMNLPNRPTALIVTDDMMALGILRVLNEIGVQVPQDVSLISFNNALITEISQPPLTSVDIQIFQLGYQAGKCLIEKLEQPNEPTKRIIIPFKLVERNSCDNYRTSTPKKLKKKK
ncbi:LacI family DNA-binding transcriptional regulator [Brevibacillus laterosporus]|uniref:LacI family DNA-binding transcriptional regulator n=1 Tax=Brevibacillus laterosporus TaxID=1465 RepID=UPI002E1C10CF|nr:LacI family DNA-binding transcriptional regulator [Brevibacillus laterosporus]